MNIRSEIFRLTSACPGTPCNHVDSDVYQYRGNDGMAAYRGYCPDHGTFGTAGERIYVFPR